MEGQLSPPAPPPRSRLRPPTRALSNSEAVSVSSEPEEKKMTKRQHALLELLSSERAYASDLALMREIHIPLALGRPVSIVPSSLKISNGESSRSVSTGSSSSASSSASSQPSVSTDATSPGLDSAPLPGSTIDLTSNTPSNFVFDPSLGPPMTPHSTKIIFTNISELAVLADLMSEGLEEAIGVDNEFESRDRVGEFFLRVASDLEGPYTRYITRHPIALAHLHSLTSPQPSPALQSYLQLTRVLSTSFTHAWDLQSLLIKPVQRLLKYSLLLQAIIDETPATHPDLAALKSAKTKMEEISRSVNEERRKAEVVRGVLGLDEDMSKRPSVMMGVGVHVLPPNIMLRTVKNSSATVGTEVIEPVQDLSNPEAALIDSMRKKLVSMTQFAHAFAAAIMDWQQTVKVCMEKLKLWALGFARVLGLSVPVQYLVDPSGLDPTFSAATQGGGESEAFNAFLALITSHLLPLTSSTLHNTLTTNILTPLSTLLTSTKSPQKLLSSLSSLEPYHSYLLNMPLSAKNRPPQSLLDASRDYVALRSILSRELPHFIGLMEKGIDSTIREFVKVQRVWYQDLRAAWRGLWECLKVDGESLFPELGMADGGEGTIENWSLRFTEVAAVVTSLKSVRPPPRMTEKEKERERRREIERERERVKDLERRERQLREMLVTIGADGPSPQPPSTSAPMSPPAKERQLEAHKRPSASRTDSSQKKKEREKSPSAHAQSPSKAAGIQNALFSLDPSHAHRSPGVDNNSGGSSRSKAHSPEHRSSSKRRSTAASPRVRGRSVGEADKPRPGYQSSEGEASPVLERGRERMKLPPVLDLDNVTSVLPPPLISSPTTPDSSSSLKRKDSTSTKKESPIYYTTGPMGPSSPTYFPSPPSISQSTSSLVPSAPGLGMLSPAASTASTASTATIQSYFSSSSTLAPAVTRESSSGSRFGFGLMKSKTNLKEKDDKARQRTAEREKRDRERTEREQKERERWEKDSQRFKTTPNSEHMFLDMGPVLPSTKPKKKKDEREAEKLNRESTHSSSTNSSGKTEKRGFKDRFSLSGRPSSASGVKNSREKDRSWSDWGAHGTILGVSMSNGSTPSDTAESSPAWSTQPLVKDPGTDFSDDFFTSQFTPTSTSYNYSSKSVMYTCRTVHPLYPPPGASYKTMPFLQLDLDDLVGVLEEIGHPKDLEARAIPFEVDGGDECLLLVKKLDGGEEGWALASFLAPL